MESVFDKPLILLVGMATEILLRLISLYGIGGRSDDNNDNQHPFSVTRVIAAVREPFFRIMICH